MLDGFYHRSGDRGGRCSGFELLRTIERHVRTSVETRIGGLVCQPGVARPEPPPDGGIIGTLGAGSFQRGDTACRIIPVERAHWLVDPVDRVDEPPGPNGEQCDDDCGTHEARPTSTTSPV